MTRDAVHIAIRGSTPRNALLFSASRALSLLGSLALTDDICGCHTGCGCRSARSGRRYASERFSDHVHQTHTHTHTCFVRCSLPHTIPSTLCNQATHPETADLIYSVLRECDECLTGQPRSRHPGSCTQVALSQRCLPVPSPLSAVHSLLWITTRRPE